MKNILLALAIVFGLGSYPTQAQNCYTVNGVQTCASSLRLFDSTARSASQPVLDLTQTWLNPAVTFSGLRLNVTDSGSASGSLLFDMQVGGTSKFSVTKAGSATFSGPSLFSDGTALLPGAAWALQPGLGFYRVTTSNMGFTIGGANPVTVFNGNVVQAADGQFIWTSANGNANGSQDTTLARGGAAGKLTMNGTTPLFQIGSSRSEIGSTADKLLTVVDSANATGLELNVGTPTLGTCTGGSLTSGSHNFSGEITGNTSGSCILNFGAPNFTNTPFCFVNDETTLTAVRISARSASSITITGAVSADSFQYFCIGRIGT